MKKPVLFAVGALLAAAAHPALAQQPSETVSIPTSSSIYARERIDLLPGFETTTNGFEANIRLPATEAGR